MKSVFIPFFLFMLATGCGQKSTIKSSVPSQRLSEAYGDGKHVVTNLTLPLTDNSLSFENPIPGLPIAGGITRFIGDILAKNSKLGKMHMSYTHPIPEIPEAVYSVRLKRFFLYMKPQGKRRIRAWLEKLIFGKGSTTFSFLDKMAVKMVSKNVENPDTFVPELLSREYKKKEVISLLEAFTPAFTANVVDPERAKELILLKYDRDNRDKDLRNKDYGHVHILETDRSPQDLKHYILDKKFLDGHYKRITILDSSILIELTKDPVSQEVFKKFMAQEGEKLEFEYGVKDVDTCTPESCLELAVPNVNLVPIAIKGNALELEGILESQKVPESFNLKGFVEFELMMDLPI